MPLQAKNQKVGEERKKAQPLEELLKKNTQPSCLPAKIYRQGIETPEEMERATITKTILKEIKLSWIEGEPHLDIVQGQPTVQK